ncbi:MFS transporter [Streptomyces sulphureus]|uniref:MFS transporter n=1 Tax=Streptomyces sulphureus TaxID=47758 RepID=UPI00037A9B4C|nr:MFS transporter [Streptomyces sulphureus]
MPRARVPAEHVDRRTVRTAVLLVVVLTAGAYLPSPLYPDYQRLFGYDDLVMTLLFATFAMVSAPALLLCGPAADRLGRRPLLRLGALLAAAGSCCFLFATSPAWLFAGRVGQALALGAATGAAQALIARHRTVTASIGGPLLTSLAFTAGTALGPAVAGALARYAPGPLVVPYVLHLVLLAWAWWRLRTVPGPAPARVDSARWRPTWPRIAPGTRKLFLAAGFNGFLVWAGVGVYLALVPALLERTLRSDDPALSGGVLGAVLALSLLAQLAGRRCDPGAAQRLGVAAVTVSLLLLAATGAASLPATLGAAVLVGVGHGLAFSGAARAVDARTPAEQRAGTGAALHLLFYLGSGVPAVAVGLMASWMPLTVSVTRLSWAGAGLGVLAVLVTARLGVRTGAAEQETSEPRPARPLRAGVRPRRVVLRRRPSPAEAASAAGRPRPESPTGASPPRLRSRRAGTRRRRGRAPRGAVRDRSDAERPRSATRG